MTNTLSMFCYYCKQPINPKFDYNEENQSHNECHETMVNWQNSEEFQTYIQMNDPDYIRLERDRRWREQQRENRRQAALQAAITRRINKERNIVHIKPDLYYQILEDKNCTIFVNHRTIIGVLWKKNYYTLEINFCTSSSYHIPSTLPYACNHKTNWLVSHKRIFLDIFTEDIKEDDLLGFYDLNSEQRDDVQLRLWFNNRIKLTVPYLVSNNEYINHYEYSQSEFERILDEIGIKHLQEYTDQYGWTNNTRFNYNNQNFGQSNIWTSNCIYPYNNRNIRIPRFVTKLINFIKNDIDYDIDKYDFFLKFSSKSCSLKIWDRYLKKFVALDNTVYSFWKHVTRYGFKPLKSIILDLPDIKLKE